MGNGRSVSCFLEGTSAANIHQGTGASALFSEAVSGSAPADSRFVLSWRLSRRCSWDARRRSRQLRRDLETWCSFTSVSEVTERGGGAAAAAAATCALNSAGHAAHRYRSTFSAQLRSHSTLQQKLKRGGRLGSGHEVTAAGSRSRDEQGDKRRQK